MLKSLTVAVVALLTAAAVPPAGAGSQATPTSEPGLTPVIWQWTALELADGTTQAPDDPATNTVQFLPDGRYLLRAACNGGSGGYTADGSSLQISPAATTLMACPEGSMADVYLLRLTEVVSFAYDEGDLVLALPDGAGVLRFAPALTGVVWEWQGFQGGDGSEVVPDEPARYTVEFFADGSVAAQADCNRGGGSYAVEGSQLDISNVFTTLMGCPPESLDSEFLRYIDEAVSHVFREGNLFLALPADAGIAAFAPVVFEETGTPAAMPSA